MDDYYAVKKENITRKKDMILGGGTVSHLSTFNQWAGKRDFACMSVTKHEYALLPAIKPSCDNTYLEKAAY